MREKVFYIRALNQQTHDILARHPRLFFETDFLQDQIVERYIRGRRIPPPTKLMEHVKINLWRMPDFFIIQELLNSRFALNCFYGRDYEVYVTFPTIPDSIWEIRFNFKIEAPERKTA